MNVLRTPKTLPGPELGIPALGFQGWYEARHGCAAYAEMVRIPRADWAETYRFLRTPALESAGTARQQKSSEDCYKLRTNRHLALLFHASHILPALVVANAPQKEPLDNDLFNHDKRR